MQQFITKYAKIILLLFVMLAAGFCYSCDRGEALSSLEPISTEVIQEAGEAPELSLPEAAARYYVHICGEVESPGVYEMEAGERIYQVVERAGGYTQAAATDFLNLAELVTDGMKLVVPDQNQLALAADLYGTMGQQDSLNPAKASKVNLNKATKEQLMTLPGIGLAKAEDIIRYRETHGGFSRIEDIMKVSGIKDAAFQKIKDSITI